MEFDFIIVGGGSAGCVLAARLSEHSQNRVLLCEAGQDTPPDNVPEDVSDAYPGLTFLNPQYQWSEIRARMRHAQNQTDYRSYEQARILGGGSSINGQLANRGLPSDYDQWDILGARGWDWSSVLPYFIKCEQDRDCAGPMHGASGPTTICRLPFDRWSGHARVFARALAEAGHVRLDDQNAEFADGYYPLPISNHQGKRVSTATAYLDETTRRRPNLRIAADTTVRELLIDGRRCVGVRATSEGKEAQFRGKEAILSSGALQSPAHLLRAGIGPAADLQSPGIEVRLNLAGVGKRLMEHPLLGIASFMIPAARINGVTRRHHQIGMRFSSHLDGAPAGDMSGFITSKSAWHAVGDRIGLSLFMLNKVYSQGGSLRLTSSRFGAPLEADFDLLGRVRQCGVKCGVRLLVCQQVAMQVLRRSIGWHRIMSCFNAAAWQTWATPRRGGWKA